MGFNISTKKILSASNIKKIIALGISLRDEMEALEKSIISEYDETKTYSKGDCFFYNGYLYRTKYTTTGAFDETKAEKIGDDLELIEKSDIEAMLGLTTDELQTLSSIILDSEVRLDKTYSSSKIFSDMQDILSQSKAFTLQEFAKASKASYHVVSATSQMTDKSVIYLMANSTNYDMYIVESDGTPTKIGDTTIDLSQFYTKTEIDNDFVKKTDADGKYATITTVDGKVDKTSILTSTPSTVTNEQVYSAFVMNTILSGKEGVANYITEPIDVNTVAKNIKGWSGNLTGTTPNGETAGWFENEYMSSNTINQKYISPGKVMYIRSMFDGMWSDWKKVCTTSVADIPTTTITPTFPSSVKIGKMHFIRYSVKNGWANVSVIMHLSASPKLDWFPIANNLPKPDKEINFSTIGESTANIAPIALRLEKLDEGRTLEMMVGAEFTVPNWYNVNFSYPVAES